MLIFRYIIILILFVLSIPLYFIKIIGDALSSLFEYFYDSIDNLGRELSVCNIAIKLRDENKELREQIKSLENEKEERTNNANIHDE